MILILVVSTFTVPRIVTKATGKNAYSEDAAKKFVGKIGNMVWTSFRKGDFFCGNLPEGLGYLLYQKAGNRLVATMDSLDLCKFIEPQIDQTVLENDHDDQSMGSIKKLLQARLKSLQTLWMT